MTMVETIYIVGSVLSAWIQPGNNTALDHNNYKEDFKAAGGPVR